MNIGDKVRIKDIKTSEYCDVIGDSVVNSMAALSGRVLEVVDVPKDFNGALLLAEPDHPDGYYHWSPNWVEKV